MHLSCRAACKLCSPQKSTFVPGSSGLAKSLEQVVDGLAKIRAAEKAKMAADDAAKAAAYSAQLEAELKKAAAAAAAAGGKGAGSPAAARPLPPPPPPVSEDDAAVQLQPHDIHVQGQAQDRAQAAKDRFKALADKRIRRSRNSATHQHLTHRWVGFVLLAACCDRTGLLVGAGWTQLNAPASDAAFAC